MDFFLFYYIPADGQCFDISYYDAMNNLIPLSFLKCVTTLVG